MSAKRQLVDARIVVEEVVAFHAEHLASFIVIHSTDAHGEFEHRATVRIAVAKAVRGGDNVVRGDERRATGPAAQFASLEVSEPRPVAEM